jgi:hypothetical protein
LEDCGGISGHAEILAAFRADPSRRNWPEELRDWVPIDYDPEALDLDRVNVLLELIGATAVDILASQLYHNELGLPQRPVYSMIEGYWVPGQTAPDRK